LFVCLLYLGCRSVCCARLIHINSFTKPCRWARPLFPSSINNCGRENRWHGCRRQAMLGCEGQIALRNIYDLWYKCCNICRCISYKEKNTSSNKSSIVCWFQNKCHIAGQNPRYICAHLHGQACISSRRRARKLYSGCPGHQLDETHPVPSKQHRRQWGKGVVTMVFDHHSSKTKPSAHCDSMCRFAWELNHWRCSKRPPDPRA
jgi:hypothetical protein